tara:strand:+ start:1467 stop:1718 length:252 start_codon:yes stop_codon:yes gene_type:complete
MLSILNKVKSVLLIRSANRVAEHILRKSIDKTISFLLNLEADNRMFLKLTNIFYLYRLIRNAIVLNRLDYSKPNYIDIKIKEV